MGRPAPPCRWINIGSIIAPCSSLTSLSYPLLLCNTYPSPVWLNWLSDNSNFTLQEPFLIFQIPSRLPHYSRVQKNRGAPLAELCLQKKRRGKSLVPFE